MLNTYLKLNQIALRHLGVWAVKAHTNPDDAELQSIVLEFELHNLGYRFKNPVVFGGMSSDEYHVLTSTLATMRGANVKHVPLFVNFPNELPNDRDYLVRRIIGAWGLDTFVIDKAVGKFGADPVSQMQDRTLYDQAIAAMEKRVGDSHIEWREIELVTYPDMKAKLERWVLQQFYSGTPVKEVLWADLLTVQSGLEIEPDLNRVQVKETLARLAAVAWEGLTQIRVKTPTDLLRMFAYLHEQDVSLATPVTFPALKLSKPQRRAIARFLESCPSLAEDLLRYRNLWLAFLKGIHPGSFKRQDRQVLQFPKLVQAYDALIKNKIKSFESKVLNADPVSQLQTVVERPGVALRKLTHLIKLQGDATVATAVLGLEKRLVDLPLPLLMQAFFAVRYRGFGEKVIINKDGKPWIGVPNDSLGNVDCTLEALDNLICLKLKGTKTWSKVWVDPALYDVVIPLNVRKQSAGLLNLARGTRLPVSDAGEVIRLFVYWQQASRRVDLDLSCMKLDADFNYTGHVSFNSYGGGLDLAVSGDIQSAPLGATEYIDIRLNEALKKNAHYVFPSILRYNSEAEEFSAMTACHAGWMTRHDVSSDRHGFDPKTVSEKVDVKGDGKIWVPFLFDVQQREIIFVDLMSKGSRVIEGSRHFPQLAAAMSLYSKARPNYGTLADWYILANGADSVERDQATVTIGIDDSCTINALRLVGAGVTSLEMEVAALATV